MNTFCVLSYNLVWMDTIIIHLRCWPLCSVLAHHHSLSHLVWGLTPWNGMQRQAESIKRRPQLHQPCDLPCSPVFVSTVSGCPTLLTTVIHGKVHQGTLTLSFSRLQMFSFHLSPPLDRSFFFFCICICICSILCGLPSVLLLGGEILPQKIYQDQPISLTALSPVSMSPAFPPFRFMAFQ